MQKPVGRSIHKRTYDEAVASNSEAKIASDERVGLDVVDEATEEKRWC